MNRQAMWTQMIPRRVVFEIDAGKKFPIHGPWIPDDEAQGLITQPYSEKYEWFESVFSPTAMQPTAEIMKDASSRGPPGPAFAVASCDPVVIDQEVEQPLDTSAQQSVPPEVAKKDLVNDSKPAANHRVAEEGVNDDHETAGISCTMKDPNISSQAIAPGDQSWDPSWTFTGDSSWNPSWDDTWDPSWTFTWAEFGDGTDPSWDDTWDPSWDDVYECKDQIELKDAWCLKRKWTGPLTYNTSTQSYGHWVWIDDSEINECDAGYWAWFWGASSFSNFADDDDDDHTSLKRRRTQVYVEVPRPKLQPCPPKTPPPPHLLAERHRNDGENQLSGPPEADNK